METLRKEDMAIERVIAEFLDKNLYTQDCFTKHIRTDSLEYQLNGIDMILSIPTLDIYDAAVDEKASTQYMKNPLPTFALELSFINQANIISSGWFIDSSKQTEYYLFQWIKARDGFNRNNFKESDIENLEYMLVSRKSLINYFEEQGFDEHKILAKNNEIRFNKVSGPIDKDVNPDFWFYYTTYLSEMPINIVLRKNVFKRLSILRGTIIP